MNREPLTSQSVLAYLGQTELSAVAIAKLAKRPVADVLHVLFAMEDQGKLDELKRQARWYAPLVQMVKDLSAGWESDHLRELRTTLTGNTRTFPESNWKICEALPKVVAFLKHVEDQPDWRSPADQYKAHLLQNQNE